MRKNYFIIILMAGLVFSGCSKKSDNQASVEKPGAKAPAAEQKTVETKQVMADNASQAISLAEKMKTVVEKKDYLLGQAEAFYKSEKFEQVAQVGQYVLQYLDKDSAQANDLIAKAKAQLQAKAGNALKDVKQALGGLNN